MSKYTTIVEYTDGDRKFVGSQRIEDGEVHVDWGVFVKGDRHCGTSTTFPNEEDAKVFFYDELKLQLGGSWLIMDTLIDKEIKVFHDKIKKIRKKVPAAVVKKYEEILGPLGDIDRKTLDSAAAELLVICDNWHNKK